MTNLDGDAYLGCGEYEVYFRNRCEETSFTCIADSVTKIKFNRILNETSSATIEACLTAATDECCECYGQVNPWEHEISIHRNGREVWCGPLIQIKFDPEKDKVTFEARDLSSWLDRRLVELRGDDDDYDVYDVDSKDVFEWLLNHAYCKDPWCMSWSFSPTGVPITRFYPAFASDERWGGVYPIVGDEMRALSREGVDYTVVCRHMFGGNLETNPPVASRAIILNEHWGEIPVVTVSGTNMSTRTGTAGGNGGYYGHYDEQIWFEPPVIGPITPAQLTSNQRRYGLLETYHVEQHLDEEDSTIDPNAITQNAFARNELLNEPFITISGGDLSPEAPINFDSLIPGVHMEVRLTNICRPFTDIYRLYEVSVSVTDKEESVSIEISPFGASTVRNLQ